MLSADKAQITILRVLLSFLITTKQAEINEKKKKRKTWQQVSSAEFVEVGKRDMSFLPCFVD